MMYEAYLKSVFGLSEKLSSPFKFFFNQIVKMRMQVMFGEESSRCFSKSERKPIQNHFWIFLSSQATKILFALISLNQLWNKFFQAFSEYNALDCYIYSYR